MGQVPGAEEAGRRVGGHLRLEGGNTVWVQIMVMATRHWTLALCPTLCLALTTICVPFNHSTD